MLKNIPNRCESGMGCFFSCSIQVEMLHLNSENDFRDRSFRGVRSDGLFWEIGWGLYKQLQQ
jgi:hypothetical protein